MELFLLFLYVAVSSAIVVHKTFPTSESVLEFDGCSLFINSCISTKLIVESNLEGCTFNTSNGIPVINVNGREMARLDVDSGGDISIGIIKKENYTNFNALKVSSYDGIVWNSEDDHIRFTFPLPAGTRMHNGDTFVTSTKSGNFSDCTLFYDDQIIIKGNADECSLLIADGFFGIIDENGFPTGVAVTVDTVTSDSTFDECGSGLCLSGNAWNSTRDEFITVNNAQFPGYIVSVTLSDIPSNLTAFQEELEANLTLLFGVFDITYDVTETLQIDVDGINDVDAFLEAIIDALCDENVCSFTQNGRRLSASSIGYTFSSSGPKLVSTSSFGTNITSTSISSSITIFSSTNVELLSVRGGNVTYDLCDGITCNDQGTCNQGDCECFPSFDGQSCEYYIGATRSPTLPPSVPLGTPTASPSAFPTPSPTTGTPTTTPTASPTVPDTTLSLFAIDSKCFDGTVFSNCTGDLTEHFYHDGGHIISASGYCVGHNGTEYSMIQCTDPPVWDVKSDGSIKSLVNGLSWGLDGLDNLNTTVWHVSIPSAIQVSRGGLSDCLTKNETESLVVTECTMVDDDKWFLTPDGKIHLAGSNECVVVSGSYIGLNGDRLIVSDCDLAISFSVSSCVDGKCAIVKQDGKCLDLSSSDKRVNTWYDCNGAEQQQFHGLVMPHEYAWDHVPKYATLEPTTTPTASPTVSPTLSNIFLIAQNHYCLDSDNVPYDTCIFTANALYYNNKVMSDNDRAIFESVCSGSDYCTGFSLRVKHDDYHTLKIQVAVDFDVSGKQITVSDCESYFPDLAANYTPVNAYNQNNHGKGPINYQTLLTTTENSVWDCYVKRARITDAPTVSPTLFPTVSPTTSPTRGVMATSLLSTGSLCVTHRPPDVTMEPCIGVYQRLTLMNGQVKCGISTGTQCLDFIDGVLSKIPCSTALQWYRSPEGYLERGEIGWKYSDGSFNTSITPDVFYHVQEPFRWQVDATHWCISVDGGYLVSSPCHFDIRDDLWSLLPSGDIQHVRRDAEWSYNVTGCIQVDGNDDLVIGPCGSNPQFATSSCVGYACQITSVHGCIGHNNGKLSIVTVCESFHGLVQPNPLEWDVAISVLDPLPTQEPTVSPTLFPTVEPTRSPTKFPTTSSPSVSPTRFPTTATPTVSPTTSQPTLAPTTPDPTASPTSSPTEAFMALDHTTQDSLFTVTGTTIGLCMHTEDGDSLIKMRQCADDANFKFRFDGRKIVDGNGRKVLASSTIVTAIEYDSTGSNFMRWSDGTIRLVSDTSRILTARANDGQRVYLDTVPDPSMQEWYHVAIPRGIQSMYFPQSSV